MLIFPRLAPPLSCFHCFFFSNRRSLNDVLDIEWILFNHEENCMIIYILAIYHQYLGKMTNFRQRWDGHFVLLYILCIICLWCCRSTVKILWIWQWCKKLNQNRPFSHQWREMNELFHWNCGVYALTMLQTLSWC